MFSVSKSFDLPWSEVACATQPVYALISLFKSQVKNMIGTIE